MEKKCRLAVEKHLTQIQRRRSWHKVVRAMACVVAFCTAYALILPAITMERDECTLTEHVHSESCYEKVLTETVKVLNCNYDSLGVHVHEADCLDAEGILICGEADYLVHTHSGECYDAEGVLMCGLPKVEEHEHTEDCYGIVETEPAETEATEGTLPEDGEGDAEAEATEPAMPEDGEEDTVAALELICDKEVIVLHSHDEEDCYETYLDEEGNEQKRLICTQVIVLEHNHDESCFVTEEVLVEDADALTCLLAEGHVHAEACYDETGALICEEVENHTHGDMCYGTWTLICGQEEHTHGEECVFPEEMEPNTLRYRGGDYEVTVRYEDSAEIPENAQLTVRELSGEEYREHLDRVYDELGMDGFNTLIQMETEEAYEGNGGENVSSVSGEINFARFFDITIWANDQEIQPKSPVEVSIIYDESVEIPEGEKTAVHFNHNGTVEILNVGNGAEEQKPAEPATYAVQSIAESKDEDENKNVFVFHQDSFSISATITWSDTNKGSIYNHKTDRTIRVEWLAHNSEKRTIHIQGHFDTYNKPNATEKVIEVIVPTGYKIISYSSPLESGMTPEGVELVEIDKSYRGQVKSATLDPAITHGGIATLRDNHDTLGETWGTQFITGYTASKLADEIDISTYGGVITWKILPNTQVVNLNLTLVIQPELLSHTDKDGNEEMGDIVITISDENGTQTVVTTIEVTAKDVQQARMVRGNDAPCSYEYNADHKSGIPGKENRSDLFPVSCSVSNYNNKSGNKSLVERAVFTLTYPKGVYYEPNTLFCTFLGFEPGRGEIRDLKPNDTTSVVDGHLTVTWNEDDPNYTYNSITWTLTNVTITHGSINEVMGALFRADNTKYAVGETISGFTFSMPTYTSNGITRTDNPNITYERTLLAGDKKDIRIIPRNFTRRNITADFGISDNDYVLGGFDVSSALDYVDNNFYFENPHGLKITALNLMGRSISNLIVCTKNARTGETREIDVFEEYPGYFSTGGGPEYGTEVQTSYNEKLAAYKVYDAPEHTASGTMFDGTYVALSLLGGQPDEYITSCYFTADTDQLTYKANYSFSGFTYIGQFSDEANGETAPRVYLQQLKDEATYDMALSGRNGAGTKNDHVYYNAAWKRDVFDADQSTIGWESTGVGSVTTTAKKLNGEAGQTYYPGSVITIETQITSGYAIKNQEMLIDPVLVINLPKGMSLDLESVYLEKAEVVYTDPQYPGGKPEREEVAHSIEILEMDPPVEMNNATWTTYLIKQKSDPYSVVAAETHISNYQREECKIKAKFNVIVSSQCKNFNLPLDTVVMWDVRNTAGVVDNLTGITEPSKNGDAIQSNYGGYCVHNDEHNFLGHGSGYSCAGAGDAIQIKPLIGFVTDLSIKPIQSAGADKTPTGFTTYDGQKESIVWVEPGKYVDVKVEFYNAHTSEYSMNTVIFVPIPKEGLDFGGKYFQNINLTDPDVQSEYKEFQYTMDLVGHVELISVNPVTELNPTGEPTQWDTYYAIDENAVENSDYVVPEEGKNDDWRPIMTYDNSNNPDSVDFYPASTINNGLIGCTWADVRMVMFKAQGNVPVGGSGYAIMRLYIHDRNATTGPANFGDVNYWRAYSKAVTDKATNVGIWAHTSVVAATPTGETVQGQFFVDNDKNGQFYPPGGDSQYAGQSYTVEIYQKNGSNWEIGEYGFLNVDKTGFFELKDRMGRTSYLPEGEYRVKIQDKDKDFDFVDVSFQGSIGNESTGAWCNNVDSGGTDEATFALTIGNGTTVHKIGIGLKAHTSVTLIGQKTFLGGELAGGDFTFDLYEIKDGAYHGVDNAKNDSNGHFAFETLTYEDAGSHLYRIIEREGNSGYITYDKATHTVTVDVVRTSDGRLVPTVTYNNKASAYPEDKNVEDWAAFTNSAANAILQGQIFVDSDQDGLFESGEKPYRGETRGKMKVTVSGPGLSDVPVTVNEDGSFALLDSEDKYVDLAPGSYTVTIVETDGSFMYANSSYTGNGFGGSIDEESPATQWHNNVSGPENIGTITAKTTWKFTVTQSTTGTEIHRVGIALKSSANIQLKAQKTFTGGILNGRDFLFRLDPMDGAPIGDPRGYAEVWNQSNGEVFLDYPISYTKPGTYRYRITEVTDTPPKSGVIYDTHVTIATVTVEEDNYDGVLSVSVVYDNSTGRTQEDIDDKTVARFTNSMSYELPATGGAGTTSYTMGGLLMVTAAILLYIYTLKRRKEDHASF